MTIQTRKTKSQAALSTLAWGIYMIVVGLSLIVFPNGVLVTMGFEPTQEVWIRIGGLLALALGFYYVQLGRFPFAPFYPWKVMAHVGGVLIMTSFYLQGLAPANIFLFALADTLAALWTAWGIKQDRKREELIAA